MVLEGRLELPWVAPLAPQASASAIPPPEHGFERLSLSDSMQYTPYLRIVKQVFYFFLKKTKVSIEKVNAQEKKYLVR